MAEKQQEVVKVEIKSLNQELYKNVSIEELEKRLEFGLWCDCNGPFCPALSQCNIH